MDEDLWNILNLLHPFGKPDPSKSEESIRKIRVFLARGVDLNASIHPGDPGTTLLHRSAKTTVKYTDLVVLKFLLQNGADPNRVDRHGYTPLYYALRSHSLSQFNQKPSEILRVYLENGADIRTGKFNEARYEGLTRISPLSNAVEAADLELAKIAVENGEDVNRNVIKLPTAVEALQRGNFGFFLDDLPEVLDQPAMLLPGPLAVAAQRASGWPPSEGYLDIVKYLLSKGANPNTICARYTFKPESIIVDLARSAWRYGYAAYPFIEIIKSGRVDVYENKVNSLPLIVAARNSLAEKDPAKKLFDDRASWYIIDIDDRRVRERRRGALAAFARAGAPPPPPSANEAAGGAGAGADASRRGGGGRKRTRSQRKKSASRRNK